MKYIKKFNESNIAYLCLKYIDQCNSNKDNISSGSLSYTINNNIVSVDGTLSLNIDLYEIPFNIAEVNSIFLSGNIKTLKNSPRIVHFSFNIGGCRNITSFLNGPDRVGGFIHLGILQIDSFVDMPRPLKDNYQITTSNYDTQKLFRIILKPKILGSNREENGYYIVDNEVCDNIEIFNDFDPIRPNNEFSLSRLNAYLTFIGKANIIELEGWKNID